MSSTHDGRSQTPTAQTGDSGNEFRRQHLNPDSAVAPSLTTADKTEAPSADAGDSGKGPDSQASISKDPEVQYTDEQRKLRSLSVENLLDRKTGLTDFYSNLTKFTDQQVTKLSDAYNDDLREEDKSKYVFSLPIDYRLVQTTN